MSALLSLLEFGKLLETVRRSPHDASAMEGVLAENMLIVSYVRAVARAEGHDETGAVLAALETIRAHNGEAAAESVAKAQGLDLDGLLEQQSEDAAQAERERAFERDVPWGTP